MKEYYILLYNYKPRMIVGFGIPKHVYTHVHVHYRSIIYKNVD